MSYHFGILRSSGLQNSKSWNHTVPSWEDIDPQKIGQIDKKNWELNLLNEINPHINGSVVLKKQRILSTQCWAVAILRFFQKSLIWDFSLGWNDFFNLKTDLGPKRPPKFKNISHNAVQLTWFSQYFDLSAGCVVTNQHSKNSRKSVVVIETKV